jgi:hypothetical protein
MKRLYLSAIALATAAGMGYHHHTVASTRTLEAELAEVTAALEATKAELNDIKPEYEQFKAQEAIALEHGDRWLESMGLQRGDIWSPEE